MLERFLLLWLTLSSLLAFYWDQALGPWWQRQVGASPFEASAVLLEPLFAVTMFCIGWMLPRDEVRQVLRRWPTVLGGTAAQYATMPALAVALVWLFGLEGDLRIGALMVGCVPGAMASNVLTMNARGDVSYSVSLTTSATLLSPLVVPLTLEWLLGREVDYPAAQESLKLLRMVVAPVVVGYAVGQLFPGLSRRGTPLGRAVANLTILWIIAVVVYLNRERLSQISASLFAALLSLNLLGYVVGYLAGIAMRLPPPMRRALTLEIGMQNAGLGTILAKGAFGLAAAIPPALYTFGCMFTGAALSRLWSKRAEGGEPRAES